MDERKKLLRIKLAANEQRLHRLEYLAELPERLSAYLEGRPYVQSPELDEIVSMLYVYPEGLRNAENGEHSTYFKPEGYVYREFSWPDQMLDAALGIGEQYDQEEALLYPFDGPLYRVPFGWARQNIVDLFNCESRPSHDRGRKYCPESVGVMTSDFKVGLVLDNYAGYLPEDPNPDETVYQLATWGMEARASQ